jgi:diguanylate cyclase (GGDEF)-like protein/PAS domain S-box-containing protein
MNQMNDNRFLHDIIVDEQLLFMIMNRLFDIVFLMKVEEGPRFRYVRVSANALPLANLTEQDIGKCIEDVYPQEIADHLNKQYKKALATREVVTYRDQMNVKGEPRMAESMIVPIVKDDGTIPYMICFTRDITEQITREQQFAEIHQLFHLLLEQSHDAIVMFDLTGRLLRINKEVERLFGWSENEVMTKNIVHFLPKYRVQLLKSLQMLSIGQSLKSVRLSLRRKDGKLAYVFANITPVFRKDGTVVAGLSLLRDITDVIHVQKQQRRSEELYRKVIEFLPDPIMILVDGIVRYMNTAGLTMLEATGMDCVKGKRVSDFLTPYNEQTNEWLLTSLSGAKKEVTVKETTIDYHGQNAQFLIIRDLTEQKKKERKIKFMAQYDPLTELPNRSYLREILNDLLLHVDNIVLLLIDIHRFQFINDFLGHENGDQLLKEVARRLKKLQSEQMFLARVGDDEFVAVYRYEKKEEAEWLLTTLDRSLNEPYFIAGEKLNVTVHIGVSYACDANHSAEGLLNNAGKAVYYAKTNGINRVVEYESKLRDIFVKRIRLENDLKTAVGNNEFSLYYQPKVNLHTGAISVEALIRWKHPQLGMVSPAEFIPIAEETSVIEEIGKWVLQQSCQDYKWLHSSGFSTLKIAVNLSARQFIDSSLKTTVANIFANANVPPSSFMFEITETTIMKEPNEVICILQSLKDQGITIAIDDFGVNYSSLNYLNRFPIDAVKIDRSFIRDFHKNEKGAEIVEAIISLAHRLNLSVTAEGVETEDQVRLLAEKGCDEMQGYYFSPPVPLEKLPNVLTKLHSWVRSWKS